MRALPVAMPTARPGDLPALFHVPGRMSEANWRVEPDFPAVAFAAQDHARQRIFLGRGGGPMARVAVGVRE